MNADATRLTCESAFLSPSMPVSMEWRMSYTEPTPGSPAAANPRLMSWEAVNLPNSYLRGFSRSD